MHIVTRIISLWRREFLNHKDYEWVHEFERFVNWARRFAIRDVPYSKMEWNHSSDPVLGMDAIAFLRALPTAVMQGKNIFFHVRPILRWKVENDSEKWVLGDVVDRSLVGEIPLGELVNIERKKVQGREELVVYGTGSQMERVSFWKERKAVSLVMASSDYSADEPTPRTSRVIRLIDACKMSFQKVVCTLPNSCQEFVSYVPFTALVFGTRYGSRAVGDACLKPAFLSGSVEQHLNLERIGICCNEGISEQVYVVNIDGTRWSLSANEINVLLAACKYNYGRFRDMVKSLKMFCSYKSMVQKDRSEKELLHCTRGRRMDEFEVENLTNCSFVSGEPGTDVDNELIEMMRRKYDGYTFVWIDKIDSENVLLQFRGSRQMTSLKSSYTSPNSELAILKETDQDKLVNSESTGLVEMAVGVQPKVRVKAYGSGLNPKVQTHDDGKEVELLAVDGLFSTCDLCAKVVCNLNGLTASIQNESQIIRVQWQEVHTCQAHGYNNFPITSGSRIV